MRSALMKGLLPEALLRQLPRVYWNMTSIVNFHCKLDNLQSGFTGMSSKRQSFPRRIPLLERQWWNSSCRGQKAPNWGFVCRHPRCVQNRRGIQRRDYRQSCRRVAFRVFCVNFRTMSERTEYDATGSWQWKIRCCIDTDCIMFVDETLSLDLY